MTLVDFINPPDAECPKPYKTSLMVKDQELRGVLDRLKNAGYEVVPYTYAICQRGYRVFDVRGALAAVKAGDAV